MKINGQEVSLYREYYNYWKEGYEYYAWILWRIRIIKNASGEKLNEQDKGFKLLMEVL